MIFGSTVVSIRCIIFIFGRVSWFCPCGEFTLPIGHIAVSCSIKSVRCLWSRVFLRWLNCGQTKRKWSNESADWRLHTLHVEVGSNFCVSCPWPRMNGNLREASLSCDHILLSLVVYLLSCRLLCQYRVAESSDLLVLTSMSL